MTRDLTTALPFSCDRATPRSPRVLSPERVHQGFSSSKHIAPFALISVEQAIPENVYTKSWFFAGNAGKRGYPGPWQDRIGVWDLTSRGCPKGGPVRPAPS